MLTLSLLHASLEKSCIQNLLNFAHIQLTAPFVFRLYDCQHAGIAQSVWRLAMVWTVWGSNPGGGEIFRACPEQPLDTTQHPVQWVPGLPWGKAASAWWSPTSS